MKVKFMTGSHLKVGFERNPGLLDHKSVTIRNEGDVPFIVHFELRAAVGWQLISAATPFKHEFKLRVFRSLPAMLQH